MLRIFINQFKFIFSILFLSMLASQAIAKTNSLPAFNAIQAKGPFTVIIKQIKSRRINTITKPKGISTHIKNHTLYLSATKGYRFRKPAIVKVNIKQLNKLIASNQVVIRGRFNSKSLQLIANNQRSIQLRGNIAMRLIKDSGAGPIDIRWINSHKLEVYGSGRSRIKLAGRANHLIVRLHNRSRLHAEYLRAKNIMIQTKGYAVAKILPTKSMNAYAYNFSNIYYYKRPRFITTRAVQNANILQVAWRD